MIKKSEWGLGLRECFTANFNFNILSLPPVTLNKSGFFCLKILKGTVDMMNVCLRFLQKKYSQWFLHLQAYIVWEYIPYFMFSIFINVQKMHHILKTKNKADDDMWSQFSIKTFILLSQHLRRLCWSYLPWLSCAAVCCTGCIWVCWVFLPLCPCASCWRCAAMTTQIISQFAFWEKLATLLLQVWLLHMKYG